MCGFGSGVGLVGHRVLWGILEESTCRRLACWPASVAEIGGGGARGFAPGLSI